MTRKVDRRDTIAIDFKKDVQFLKSQMPPLLPVRVYRRPTKGCLGYTNLTLKNGCPSHFIIVVSSTLSWDATWQVLIHEWAHAMSWVGDGETFCDHGPEWGLWFAKIYQEIIEP